MTADAPSMNAGAGSRPTLVLAMGEGLHRRLFTSEQWDFAKRLCRVPDDGVLSSFESPHAQLLLQDAQVLLTGWGCPPIDAAVLERAPRLQLIAHAAGSVKGHVTEPCWERGLQVTSAAAANAVPVAEYTLATILFANKGAFWAERRYRSMRGRRSWADDLPASVGNYGKTIGVVGASRVGRRVIELLRLFDLHVLVTDPFLEPTVASRLGAEKVELDELLTTADVVSLHAPALTETRHMIDRRKLALMRDGAVLINTARGSLVDHAALVDELASGRLAAVLDTTEPEPLPEDSALFELPNVFVTPHVAGSLGTEVHRLAALALDEIARWVAGLELRHEVTREDLSRIA